jgi:hypothetical protein
MPTTREQLAGWARPRGGGDLWMADCVGREDGGMAGKRRSR